MKKTSKEKYRLSMAGEYGACAELLKIDFDVSITFDNMKAMDLMAKCFAGGYKTV